MLTDYLDGEMGKAARGRLEKHLAGCPGCKNFSLSASEVGPALFAGAAKAQPPEYLWRRVREAALAEAKRRVPAAGILGRLRPLLYIPRPVLAVATVVILLLAVGTIAGIRYGGMAALQPVAQSQNGYFDYLTEPQGGIQTDEGLGFGTQVEKYFL